MGIIRYLLALSVLVTHSAPICGLSFTNGDVAVQSFFIISGFYMALILDGKYRDQKNRYSLFLSNRLLRIYPGYLAILAVTTLLRLLPVAHLPQPDVRHFATLTPASLLFMVFTNVFLFGQDLVMFAAVDIHSGLLYFTKNFWLDPVPASHLLMVPQAWSVGMELAFYLIAPLLVTRRTRILLAVGAASVIFRAFLSMGLGLSDDPWTYRFLPTELATFTGGIVAYRAYRSLGQTGQFTNRYVSGTLFAAMVTLIIAYGRIRLPHKRLLLYVLLIVSLPFIFEFTKFSRLDRFIGELSYPFYLCHLLTMSLLIQFDPHPGSWVIAVWATLLSVAILQWIDRPIDRIRQARVVRAGKTELLKASGAVAG